MEKLKTIQKRNNLNAIYTDGDVGPGGAHHDYVVMRHDASPETGLRMFTLGEIIFQCGPRGDKTSRDGVLDTDLLEIVRDRLTAFNKGEFATRENACAITHIEEALMWMNKRVEDRAERGVLGTMEK